MKREGSIFVTDIHEAVSLYALDALDGREKAEFELHLERGCAPCEAELRLLRAVTDEMAIASAVPLPARLKDRVMAKSARAPRAPGFVIQESGLLISRSAELTWQKFSPGIEYKALGSDVQRDYHTMLVRMEAGARYSAHRHTDIEELFMLSGDLHVAGEVMLSGDYCRADTGTVHGETFSESGCLFLMVTSGHNEVMSAGIQ